MNNATTFLLEGSFVSQQPLATCSKDLKDAYEAKNGANKPIPVPSMSSQKGSFLYFPATGIKGSIRRALRDFIRARVIAKTGEDKPFSLDDHYLLTLGGVKGTGEGDRASVVDEESWRTKNPLLSLFGAGAAGHLGFVHGHLHVSNAVCEEPVSPVIFAGARADDLYRNKEQAAYLTEADLDALIGRAKGTKAQSDLKAELKSVEKDLRVTRKTGSDAEIKAIEARIVDIKTQIESVASASGTGGVSVGMPLAGYQAIPQGQTMKHTFRLVLSNDIELGCLLSALHQFAKLPLVGAHRATGCGEVSGQWDAYEVTDAGKQLIGTVTLNPYEPLGLSSDRLSSALKQFSDFVDGPDSNFHVPTSQSE